MSLFNRVKIRTPESVELEFRLAGIGNRAVALLVDYLIWGLLLLGLLSAWAWLSYQIQVSMDTINGAKENGNLWLTAVALLIVFGVYTGYFVVFETLWQGQTPGKRYAKIRVIREDGQPVGLAQALLRSLLRPLDDIAFLGMLLIILGQREKRLGDWVAGTLVIQEDRSFSPLALGMSPEVQTLSLEMALEHEVGQLHPDDFAVIREYLQRRQAMDWRARSELAIHLAQQAIQLMGLSPLPFETSPEVFLEAVYLAYQQQTTHE
ncbi:RDD family protein [Lyngbya confervoides]|uniref:RDD family protein n=1 Tax=Lyngbya confervoides BDU141951 TaxID=1574623 RepID=A0ABD4T7W4_9CYAN|nr:RDD family protein [Lyngbya confervoides]MCM1984563.1 RDD family protein [Lyngbya confervoides BDU141951]